MNVDLTPSTDHAPSPACPPLGDPDLALGTSHVASAERRLKELNPRLRITSHTTNVSMEIVENLAAGADAIVDCAPLFGERFAMNACAVRHQIPLIECARYELEAQITALIPSQTPCIACLHPERPILWKREFPVFGAVSETVSCLGAMEAIKAISDLGELLTHSRLRMDLRTMEFQRLAIKRDPDCSVCRHIQ